MVTGRISLRVPEYSPISFSVNEVRRSSSSFHCRAATVLVTRMSVVAAAAAIAPAPTIVLPAPQGSTTTPTRRARSPRRPDAGRAASSSRLAQRDRVGLAVDVAGEVLGGPADLEQLLLEMPALGGVHQHRVGVDAFAEQRLIFLCRNTSSSTGRSVACRTRPCTGSFSRVSRP
jgi:hypothetical protein